MISQHKQKKQQKSQKPLVDSFTNNVFYLKTQGKNAAIQIYLPCYVRITFKKISKINIQDSKADMIATMLISYFHKSVPQQVMQKIDQKIQMTINGQKHRKLGGDNTNIKCTKDKDKSLATYTIRDIFELQMSNDEVFWAPFDTLDLSLTVAIRAIQQIIDGQKYVIKFNCMDTDNFHVKFSQSQSQNFGQFGLARSKITIHYCNSQRKLITQKQKKLSAKDNPNKIISFQYAIFNISIYRLPTTTLFTIFLPLWLLAVINLAVFFTANQFKDRVANIATLLVAYTAFLPTIRQRIPPTPKITLIDYIVYSLLINSFLCLGKSFIVKDIKEEQYKLIIWAWKNDGFFIISLIITAIGILTVITILIIFKFIWQPHYITKKSGEAETLKMDQWHNLDCDQYFKQLRPSFRYKIDALK